jgi:hypothetical protein
MLVHLLELFWQHAYAHKMDIERAVRESIYYTKTTAQSSVLEKLLVTQPIKRFPLSHATGIFIYFYNSQSMGLNLTWYIQHDFLNISWSILILHSY